jgi:deleted-in-malignant-brain-tumors protein 1
VEVCVGGRYGTVCDEDWDYEDASVVCSELGFSANGAIPITGGLFSNASVSVVIGRVECASNETGLLDCSHVAGNHKDVRGCDPSQTAAVACQDLSTGFADCTTGEVRFQDFTDNSEEGSRQGTLQICINNAWGSVCSDDYFDSTDAEVFCSELVGFTATGMCRIPLVSVPLLLY